MKFRVILLLLLLATPVLTAGGQFIEQETVGGRTEPWAIAPVIENQDSYAEASLSTYWERVLVPFAFGNEIPGAEGSRWITRLIVRNDDDQNMYLDSASPIYPCGITCVRVSISPQIEEEYEFSPTLGMAETFLYVNQAQAGKASFHLRIQDVSRQNSSWGTEIPVVRESDYRTGRIQLLNVPLNDRFRISLRVYDFEARDGERVQIRIYPFGSNVPVLDREVILRTPGPLPPVHPPVPASTKIHDLSRDPGLQGLDRVRIELTTLRPGTRFWAFVSVTNNDTQQVTTFTPQ